MNKLIEDIKYLKYTLFHPFDAFYEIKWRGKGNIYLALCMYILYAITSIIFVQYTGFIMNTNNAYAMNSLVIITIKIAPLLLFIVSNWSVATLYNGKGRLRDLFIVVGYALVPVIIGDIIMLIISQIIIAEEKSLLLAFYGFMNYWYIFLIFCGFTTVHEYTVKESVLTFLATAIAAIVIIFICVLYFSLMEQFVGFIGTLFQEIITRG